MLVERDGFDYECLLKGMTFEFYVDVEYVKFPSFCYSCQIIGHTIKMASIRFQKLLQV